MVLNVRDINNCIFNLHCPPYNTGIDQAPELDETLKPVIVGAEIRMKPAGSIAVLNSIQKYQPLLGLHGHIHESRGVVKVGRTFCLNPGSEYLEGILRGAIVILDEKSVKGYILTSG
jgi:Icc-related predicted phosphoesterase